MSDWLQAGEQKDGTWLVRAGRVEAVQAAVEKLNRRVKRTGGEGVTVEVEREALETAWFVVAGGRLTEKREGCIEKVLPWAYLRLGGAVPVVAGWKFISTIEHTPAGNILRRAPNCETIELPEDLRTATNTCDHCHTERRRLDTFVLQDAAGQIRRVGRNCLADFLRTEDLAGALRMWALLDTVRSLLGGEDGYEGGSGYGQAATGTLTYLACAASAIRNYGWVSRKVAREVEGKTATATTADFLAGPKPRNDGRRGDAEAIAAWEQGQPIDADTEEAAATIEWALGLEPKPAEDYLWNLRVAIALGYVEGKHEGIVASAIVAYRRATEQEVKRAAWKNAPDGGHFGEVGKRTVLPALTVQLVRYIDGNYGTTTLVVFTDEQNRRYKWFASGSREFHADERYVGKATVKQHGEYQGRKETVLTRAALERAQEEATDAA